MKSFKIPKYISVAIVCFFTSILLFIFLFILDKTNFPTKIKLVDSVSSKEWLNYAINYFGSIFASVIGFLGAIIAVFATIEEQDRCKREDSRKNVLPLIKIKERTSLIKPKEGLSLPVDLPNPNSGEIPSFIALSFKNIGQREMYHVYIGQIKQDSKTRSGFKELAPIIYKGDEYSDLISIAVNRIENAKSIRISFKIYYSDCYGNWYYQIVDGYGTGNSVTGYRIDCFEVSSAPALINIKELPKAIRNNIQQ